MCNEDYKINFSKETCIVVDKNDETMMKLQRTADNYNRLILEDKSKLYNSTIVHNTNVWHHYLGHIN